MCACRTCRRAALAGCIALRGLTLCRVQMLKRLMTVCSAEGVDCSDEGGLEAIIFTAEGDMRQALNNLQVTPVVSTVNPLQSNVAHGLQSTFRGYGCVNGENVFKVCDQASEWLLA
jgi:replication factor C subunit 2/4